MTYPDPTAAQVAIWLKRRNREELQDIGWIEISKRFPGMTDAVGAFLKEHYQDDNEQRAAYDGLTLALWVIAHFQDIERLASLNTDDKINEIVEGRD